MLDNILVLCISVLIFLAPLVLVEWLYNHYEPFYKAMEWFRRVAKL